MKSIVNIEEVVINFPSKLKKSINNGNKFQMAINHYENEDIVSVWIDDGVSGISFQLSKNDALFLGKSLITMNQIIDIEINNKTNK